MYSGETTVAHDRAHHATVSVAVAVGLPLKGIWQH